MWAYAGLAFPVFTSLLILGTLVVHGAGGLAMRTGALLVLAVGVLLVSRAIARDTRLPRVAEFDGRVIEAWVTVISDSENGSTTYRCLAIDGGARDQAWAVTVSARQYATFLPGSLVHVTISPRRNTLLDIRLLPVTRR